MKGTVKKCIREKGFGFIAAENGKEIFFHRSSLDGVDFDNLDESASVEFDVEQSPKGERAANVRLSG